MQTVTRKCFLRASAAFSVFGASGVIASADSGPQALDPKEWKTCKLLNKEKVNHDSVKLRFGLDDSSAVTGLSTASCLLLRAPIGKETEDGTRANVIRPYTPISDAETRGYFDLLVKVYEQGKMSKHVDDMNVGDTVEVKGPIQKLPYQANMKKRIGMIAGGTGITPMYQVIDEILKNSDDKTEVSLVYANKTPSDILLKDTLDKLAVKYPNFKVQYVVSDPGILRFMWKGSVGYVTEDIIKDYCPPPAEDNLILVCGPPPMMKVISGDKAPDKSQGELSGMLAGMGYTANNVYKF